MVDKIMLYGIVSSVCFGSIIRPPLREFQTIAAAILLVSAGRASASQHSNNGGKLLEYTTHNWLETEQAVSEFPSGNAKLKVNGPMIKPEVRSNFGDLACEPGSTDQTQYRKLARSMTVSRVSTKQSIFVPIELAITRSGSKHMF